MLTNKNYDIFISYRHNNMTIVGELVHRLEMYYDVFWDQRLESGYWNEQLTTAIDNSRAVLINLTLNSLNKNLNGEDWFYNEDVDIIPVGKAIQKLRDSVKEFDYENGGISLNRDGFHITLDYGRFAAAAVWLKKLTNVTDIDIQSFAELYPENTFNCSLLDIRVKNI